MSDEEDQDTVAPPSLVDATLLRTVARAGGYGPGGLGVKGPEGHCCHNSRGWARSGSGLTRYRYLFQDVEELRPRILASLGGLVSGDVAAEEGRALGAAWACNVSGRRRRRWRWLGCRGRGSQRGPGSI